MSASESLRHRGGLTVGLPAEGLTTKVIPTPLKRTSVKTIEKGLMSLNETILNDIFNIYKDKEVGLCRFGKLLGLDIKVPRQKVNVLLLGNHSAGKSSFINWYIEESILKTGVAIETQGFNFVVSGKKRDTLKGLATFQLYPHLKPLQDLPGVVDFLSTEISTSRAKKFTMVTFIDTPGLVDGDMHYPFDVNETLMGLGEMADMVLVFFDPMGQALCKRTLNIIEKMWADHSEKIRFYLAKADEAGSETDRQKVLMQIVQELCKRPGLNRTGFDMPTIFLPDSVSKPTKCVNQIGEVCETIEKTIAQTVQNSLNNLEKDCEAFQKNISSRLEIDKAARSRNRTSNMKSWFRGFIGTILAAVLILCYTGIIVLVHHDETDDKSGVKHPSKTIHPADHPEAAFFILFLSIALIITSRYPKSEPTLPSGQLKLLRNALDTVGKNIEKKKTMYKDYLRQSVGDQDFLE